MKTWRVTTALTVLVGIAVLGFFLMRGNPPRPPAPANDDALHQIVKNLGSHDSGVAENARKMLAQIPSRQVDDLRKVLEEVSDVKVQQVLATRIEEMEEDSRINPPPVTLHVNEATLQEVAQKMSAAMGIELKAYTPGKDLYTVDLDDTPYWEVVKALHKFGDVAPFQAKDGTFGFIANHGSEGLEAGKVQGPIMMWARRDRASPTSDVFVYAVMADPRTPVAAANLKITVLDTAGKEVIPPGRPVPPDIAERMVAMMEGNKIFGIVDLAGYLEKVPGAKIGSVRMKLRSEVALKSVKVETKVADANKDLNQVLRAGNSQVTISRLMETNGFCTLVLTCKTGKDQTPVHVKVVDATGEVRFLGYVIDAGGTSLGKNVSLPCHVEFEAVQAMKLDEMDGDFEMSKL